MRAIKESDLKANAYSYRGGNNFVPNIKDVLFHTNAISHANIYLIHLHFIIVWEKLGGECT